MDGEPSNPAAQAEHQPENEVQKRLRTLLEFHASLGSAWPPPRRQRPSMASSRSSTSVEPSGPPTPVQGKPNNWGNVHSGLSRSSYPQPCNHEYMVHQELRTIVTLVSTEEPGYDSFVEEKGIVHHRIVLPAHKEDGQWIPEESMREVLGLLQEEANYPMLVHCNKGKHRTGCAVACYRLLNGWSKDEAIEEYRFYAGEKARALDEKYICEIFDPERMRMSLPSAEPPRALKGQSAAKGVYPTPPPSDRSFTFSSMDV